MTDISDAIEIMTFVNNIAACPDVTALMFRGLMRSISRQQKKFNDHFVAEQIRHKLKETIDMISMEVPEVMMGGVNRELYRYCKAQGT